ncbi:ABC transporter substrate-binding protein [Amycolatopsis sp. WAC 01375]|uniref:glutamate ABC transporter substrate-binding protein n=1 Tax=unclassified Amycolatopsis TaxID=2618356 RepID=UPI000F787F5E|nr:MULTISPECIES: glutamate ABC transporter substrate-binding protein [unclassified Amycolatopsis]RSM70182.1 ABC transporter substrate-binding protein [Amycolatopsis sp. WAC 01375]RSN21349.1 ABC transporter substrate-binding protein [Amycolatopsis sp. WAC 01416]
MRGRGLLVACLMLVTMAACSTETGPSDSLVVRAVGSGELTIGIRFDQPGLSKRTIDGRYVGFDVDVAKYVASELGVDEDHITWHDSKPSSRETDITSGTTDLMVASYSITEKRKQMVAFAGPYFDTGQDLLVRLRSTDITGPENLNGRKLCAVGGTTSAEQVRDKFAQAVQLVEYPRYQDCVTALLAGQVDAVTTDDVILAGYVAQNPELLRVVGKPFSKEKYGVGLRKDDTEGRAAVARAIQKMISSGEWLASLNRNIGPSGYRIPPPPQVTEQ